MTIQEAAEKYKVSSEVINQYIHRSNVPVSQLIHNDCFTEDGEKWLQKHFAHTGYISYFEDDLYLNGTEYDYFDDEKNTDENAAVNDDPLMGDFDTDEKENAGEKNDNLNLDFPLDFDWEEDVKEKPETFDDLDLDFTLDLDEDEDIHAYRSDAHVPLSGYLAEFRKALQDEIAAIKKSGQSSTLLNGGHVIAKKGNDTWYQFRIQYMPNIPADTPCKLIVGSSSYEVTVINVEETSIILSTTERIPETIAEAQLENGSTVLMELLIKRIEKNSRKDNPAGKRMLEGVNVPKEQLFQQIHDCKAVIDSHFTTSQQKAIISGLTNNITYIWGPPGTGKTSVIGTLISELFKAHRSVLLVSHTNTAVDGAIKKVDKEYTKANSPNAGTMYPFLRLGIPADKDMPDRLLMQSHVEELGAELYTTRKQLAEKQLQKQQKEAQIDRELQEAGWVYSNNVQELARILTEKESQEEKVVEVNFSFAEIQRQFHEEKANHPEYQNLSNLKMQLKKTEEHDSLLKKRQIETTENQSRIETELQTAKDAIIQHKEYSALKEKESQMMSLSAQEKRIQGVKTDIAGLETEKAQLQADIKIVIAQIEDYEQSGLLGRIGKKKTYETNLERRRKCEERIRDLSVKLPVQYELSRKFDEEIRATRLLKAQIERIHLTGTLEYWEMQEKKSEEAQKRYADIFNQITEEIARNNNLLSQLHSDIQRIEVQCQPLSIAEKEYSSCLSALKEAKDTLEHLEEELENVYHTEVKKTHPFFIPDGKNVRENTELLQAKLDELSFKYINISIQNLETENETVKREILELQQQINEIDQKLDGLEKQVIMEAAVIGTTLAKSYLNDSLQERRFDTVILDEASMASIPALWCASCLAESNIVIVGDFLQLAPIVIANTDEAKEWLGKDIFEKSGMVARLDRKEQPDNFVMLNDQFRMEKEIADIANNLYYSKYGGLKSNDHTARRDEERAEFHSWYSGNIEAKHSIHLINTESMHAWVTGVKQGKGHSRLNCFSAALDVNIAFTLVENKLNNGLVSEPAVLIVVPYKPHANLVQKMIDLEYQNRGLENQNLINVGTVHSFQGKEADIVIFDLVVDEPHRKANLFMPDDTVGDSLNRMFNVAVTRARFELFVVGNFKYCMSRAKTNSLGRFLSYLCETCHLRLWDAKKLFPKMKYVYRDNSIVTDNVDAAHMLCRDDSFDQYLKKDLLNAQNRIIIYSPFMTEARVSILLPFFDEAQRRGVTIVIVTKATGELNKHMAIQKKQCETILSKHGIHLIHRKGMHEKIILIDNTIVWNGSLNIFSFSGSTGEVMERFACSGKSGEENNIVNSYVQAYDVEQMLEIVKDESQGYCPICHGLLLFCEGKNGDMYWECENKDYSRPTSQPYPKDGELHCKTCGGRFCYKRKKEPRWVCRNNSDHYQKLRKSDLKLPKMAALIPSEYELEKINEYFANF